MAILANGAYTLADYRAATGENGQLRDVIDMLSQTNEILADMPWIEANSGMEHKTTQRTSLASGAFRMFNQGVPYSKNTSATITETCAMLEEYSRIDRDMANLNGNSAAWRLQEDGGAIEGLNQQMASYAFYANSALSPAAFTGFTPRFNTLNTAAQANAVNVIDAGGRGNTNASIWLVGWGPRTVHGIYPKGSKAGLQINDVSTPAPVYDDQGRPYQALQTHLKWDCGMAVRDWRYVVRIANIDVSQLTSASAANLFALLIAACNKTPTAPSGMSAVQAATEPSGEPVTTPRFSIYMNRTLRTACELQMLGKSNALIQLQQYGGMVLTTFRGVPIRTVDTLLNTEATVV